MPRDDGFATGRVFVVPLLGGGFAFGYATAQLSPSVFVNIFDHVSDNDTLPSNLAELRVELYDLQIGGEFRIMDATREGDEWRWCDERVQAPIAPRNRYVQMGLPPRRIDVLGEEPDRPLTPEQAKGVPFLGFRFAPYTVALIEVALKRLDGTPKDLINSWRARPPSKASSATRRAGAKTKKDSPKPNAVHIEVRLRGKGLPTSSDLDLRHRLEAHIAKQKLGAIVDAGGGFGLMDVVVQTDAPDAIDRIRAMLDELGVPKSRAKITAIHR